MLQLLTTEFPDCTVSEASTAPEGLEAVWNESWNLVLLDISLPGRNGLELLKELKAARPKLSVLILSSYPESQFATRVLKAGAAGYLTKESPPETIVRAVRQVLTGSKFISPWVAERLASEIMLDSSKPAHELLSDREYDVMLRIASGQAVGEIAVTLNLSVKTISTYRTRILEKMGMKNNAELMQYALRNTLIE
jgi:two-component system invasion response regulator UvrY